MQDENEHPHPACVRRDIFAGKCPITEAVHLKRTEPRHTLKTKQTKKKQNKQEI